MDRGVHCGTASDTLQLPQREVYYALFLFVCLSFSFVVGVAGQRADPRGQGDEGTGVHGVKLTQNEGESFKKKKTRAMKQVTRMRDTHFPSREQF